MEAGDLPWEVPGRPYFSQYNEATGREGRIRRADLDPLCDEGWVRLIRHDVAMHRLDYWEITDAGRTVLAESRQRKGPVVAPGGPSATRRSA